MNNKFSGVAAPTAQPAPREERHEATRQTLIANVITPLVQAAIPAFFVTLIVFAVVAGIMFTKRVPIQHDAWVYVGLGCVVVFSGLVLLIHPARQALADENTRKEAVVQLGADSNHDGFAAHWTQTNGKRPSDSVIIDQERASFLAFIRTAETANTVRALDAHGWRDHRLIEKYKLWLNMLTMPDGGKAAEGYGKGQWRLRYSADEIAFVVDKLTWTVDVNTANVLRN